MTNDSPTGRQAPEAAELDAATKPRIRAEEVERAQAQADAKYPADIDVVSVEQAQANGPLNADYDSQLIDQAHADLASRAGITTAQLTQIAVEAQQKNWALPSP